MKSYERVVVWLDYLDSERKRSEGRRVPLNSCSRAPTLDGYVSLKKTAKKQPALIQIARELARVKGEKAASQGKLKGKS